MNTANMSYNEQLRLARVERGIINMDGVIDGPVAAFMMGEVMLARSSDKCDGKITVYLNSPGGSVAEALAMYDVLRAASDDGLEVNVVAMGLAASAASMIVLQAGDARQSFPNTRFMVHEMSRFLRGPEKTSETKDAIKEMTALQKRVLTILSKRTGKTPAELSKSIGRTDKWLSPEEAKAWGLIDDTVSSLV